ncbi:glycosyltransferase family 39 protein [Almyronema epifaneia]|uniref:Glycosyltransferase family 39 protein n=1 Tax=Almyronema epifaneia S1 TaxID=2991925 RepID=A0ABW6IIV3_9CYAN
MTESEALPLAEQGNAGKLQRRLSLVFVLFGMAVRLAHYGSNRSLWIDESFLAANILNRSYGELLSRLDYEQVSPPLFLWLEKLCVQLLGNSEYSLRLLPLVASLVAMGLFYRLADRVSQGWVTPVAIALFAASPHVIYFAAEVKSYGVDIAIALVLFLALWAAQSPLSRQKSLQLGSLGAVCIWLSYPSVFMLAAMESVTLLQVPPKQLKTVLRDRAVMYGLWLSSFGAFYVLIIERTKTDLVDNWDSRFPNSWLDIGWIFDSLGRFFHEPLGFASYGDGAALIAFGLGGVWLYRRSHRLLAYLIAPLLVTLLAGYLHQYPFWERLVVFLVPFPLVLIAVGIVGLTAQLQRRRYGVGWVGLLMLILLVFTPVSAATQKLLHPEQFLFQHVRPVIEHIRANWQPSDRLFVFSKAKSQFIYYSQRYGFAAADYEVASFEARLPQLDEFNTESLAAYRVAMDRLLLELEPLRGQPRVWLLLARDRLGTAGALITDLDHHLGQRLDIVSAPESIGLLYDMR